jgi:hypothetical protein
MPSSNKGQQFWNKTSKYIKKTKDKIGKSVEKRRDIMSRENQTKYRIDSVNREDP